MQGTISSRIEIRPMVAAEVGFAIDCAAAEGWNPGDHDAACFLAADADGFLVAVLDERPVGCVSAVRYADDFGFIGLFIVVPELRGQGIGMLLWDSAMARLAGRTIGLDGVVAMQGAYAASGFEFAHRNIRYAGPVMDRPQRVGASRPCEPGDLESVLALDARGFGFRRTEFITAWLAQPGGGAFVHPGADGVLGYAVSRPCREGVKIGPLFAADLDVADDLFATIARSQPQGTHLVLDVPEPHHAAVALAERHGMAPVFETARMYRGSDPGLPLHLVFGITTFELG